MPKRDAESGPAVVNYAANDEPKSQVSVPDTITFAGPGPQVGILVADTLEKFLCQKWKMNGEIAFWSDSGTGG
jgi:hypothetical protein